MILILRGKRLGFSPREIKDYLDLYEVDPTQREKLRLCSISCAAASPGWKISAPRWRILWQNYGMSRSRPKPPWPPPGRDAKRQQRAS
jgi:DNA-binding transcriptional MerR regulator